MIKNYFKIAWRTLKRNKVYGLINVIGLTLSIASSILLFSFIAYHLDFDGFHAESDKIYRIVTKQERETVNYTPGVPSPLGELVRSEYDFEDEVARLVTFEEIQMNAKRGSQEVKFVEEKGAAFAELSYFEIFNFPLSQGTFSEEFEEPNKAYVTERIAKKYFGKTDVIGEIIKIDNSLTVSIIGILEDLPSNTMQKTEIFVSYISLKEYNEWFINPDSWGGISSSMQCFIKLKDGVQTSQVEQAMAPFPAKYRSGSTNVHTYFLQPLADIHFNPELYGEMPVKTLWTLGIVGLFLLLSACLNFINLATAQVLNRLKEVGVRKSLGSKKGQLFWQFMSETALIAFVSTLLGYVLAVLFLPSLNELFNSTISNSILFDWRVLSFIFITFFVSTVVSGAYPGLILSNFKPITALKGKLAQVSVGGFNLRRSLIIVQFVISQVLIIGMLVIIKQMKYSQNADLGFDKEAIVMVPVASGMEAKDFTTFKERLSAFPGIESTTVCMAAPASQVFWGNSITFKGKTEQEGFPMSVRAGDENYVKTFGLNIIAGRNIAASDTLNELLINETFVKKMNWESPNEAIGKFIETNGVNDVQIVGVVSDFHDRSMHGDISALGIGAYNNVYWNFGVKVNPSNISGSLMSIEEVWTSMNPNGIFKYEFVDESIAKFYASEQTFLKLIQLFTIIAIFIGSMGLYGLISFMVERKTKEIGVRKVLGSTNAAILWLFGKEFGLLLFASFVIASPLAWWLGTQWLQDFKYQVEISPAQFGYALGISTLIAVFAIGYKALQASLANPVKSLRSE